MQYQELGNTGTFVSRLCLGTMTFGGAETVFGLMGNLGQKEADQLVGRALEAGVNFVDTANTYGAGESETLTGKARRDRIPGGSRNY
jgi:aryl-alcohol dehydrogenase-like predicted oxidoreductase